MMKILLLTCLLSINSLAEGKIYKWKDENGTTHYSETKPESVQTSEVHINTAKPTSAVPIHDLNEKFDRKQDTTNKLKKFAQQDQLRRNQENEKRRRCRVAKKSMQNLKDSFSSRKNKKTGSYIFPSVRNEARIIARQQERIRKKQIQVNSACKKWNKK